MIALGATVKDRITGFTGVVTGTVQYLTGCNQVLVTPKARPGAALEDSRWFDEQRMVVDAKVKRVVLDNGASPGFDKAAPIR